MSRPRLLRPMAPDLAALGDQLEAAVHQDVRRRRARRQTVLNAAASIAIAVPLAISVAFGSVGKEPESVGPAGASITVNWGVGGEFSLRHIPEKPIRTMTYLRCLDARDCPVYQEPLPFVIDYPPRRA